MKIDRKALAERRAERRRLDRKLRDGVALSFGRFAVVRSRPWWYVMTAGRRGLLLPVSTEYAIGSKAAAEMEQHKKDLLAIIRVLSTSPAINDTIWLDRDDGRPPVCTVVERLSMMAGDFGATDEEIEQAAAGCRCDFAGEVTVTIENQPPAEGE